MIKKTLTLLIFSLFILACKEKHPTNYITFKGKLINNTDSLLIIAGKGIHKKIKLNADGSFKDTLKVEAARLYSLTTNTQKRGFLYLDNGYNLELTGNANEFMHSFSFTGKGAKSNNLVVSEVNYNSKIGNPMEFFALEKPNFYAKIATIKKGKDSILARYKNADSALISQTKSQNERMFSFLESSYEKQHTIAKQKAEKMAKVAKGKLSPKFVNYTNFKGGTTSLDNFKGKYVYIDMWATWCGPCIREIPALKKIEKEYHNKNIVFISISTDESRRSGGSWEKAEAKWKNFVAKNNLTGVQLWSGKDFSFQQAYQVNAIPRFILIDPQGKIVNNNAPRPSNPALKELLNSLL